MIIGATVKGLFDEFDHEISLQDDWEFAIAYGLNGVGKTRFLELIGATASLNFAVLSLIKFNTLELRADDGSALRVTHTLTSREDDDFSILQFNLSGLTESNTRWEKEVARGVDVEFTRWLRRNTGWVQRSSGTFEERYYGDIADINDLRNMYYDDFQAQRRTLSVDEDLPDSIQAFTDKHPVYLIETQRLGGNSARIRGFNNRAQASPRWTVDGYADDLKDRLQRALAENSLRSQRLDRSFPGRLLDEQDREALDKATIEEEFSRLRDLRERLADIGLTTADDEVSLPEHLEDWQRMVLTNYIDDSKQKLATFDDLRQKINLLEELVNGRFLRKKIDVSVDSGLSVLATRDGSVIPASGLSSGEQHELVLIYNLLFRVSPETLVLIDEPEISLHVSWQQQFLSDILRIAQSSELKFIVATHSPNIIDKWWDRTVELGPKADCHA